MEDQTVKNPDKGGVQSVALLAGFAMLYMQQSNRDSKIKLVQIGRASCRERV